MKYRVEFSGGELRDNSYGCYMICEVQDKDGDGVELYAEYPSPDEWDEDTPQCEVSAFEDEAFETLKTELLQQAKEVGISADQLEF